MSNNTQQQKKPEIHKLFPIAGSLNEALELLEAKVPESLWNDVYVGLMIYHNTLIKEMNCISNS